MTRPADSPKGPDDRSPDVIAQALPPPTKTPFYQASNAGRYQRQAVAKLIEKRIKHPLICYVCGRETSIDRDDTIGLVDLLHNVPTGSDLHLLIHTGGGDMDAAEKLASLVRSRVTTGQLSVVIPDFAKSAGTLLALAGDRLVMSDTSELGPIDPQIVLADSDGNMLQYPIQSYLDAYEAHSEVLRKDPSDVASQIMISKFDPAKLKLYEAARERAKKFAETQLVQGMFRNGGAYTKTAGDLLDTKRWLSHGQMISWQDAQVLGLTVEYLDPSSDAWQEFWQLYCLQRLAVRDREKLFESSYASLVIPE